MEPIDVRTTTEPKKIIRIRYPGDLVDMLNMSRKQLEKSVLICKQKIKTQNKTIRNLRQQMKRREDRINTLNCLLKDLKKKFALSNHATESIEVN